MSHVADDRAARPQPTVVTPTAQALEAINAAHQAAQHAHDAAHDLLELAERADRPAELRIITIPNPSNGQNPVNDRHRNAYKSIGLIVPGAAAAGGGLNPNGVGVYLGVAGMSGRPGSGAPFVPPGGALVLPVSDIDVELGADPAILLASFVVCYVLFYDSVQPLFVR